MIMRLLKWQVMSDAALYRMWQAVFAITACLIVAVGSICVERFAVSVAQAALGIAVIFSLLLQLVVVYELLALQRKAA
jgi:hypothetical protein